LAGRSSDEIDRLVRRGRLWTLGRARLGLLASLLALTAAAWALTLYGMAGPQMAVGTATGDGMAAMSGMAMDGTAMNGMAMSGWSPAGALVFVAVWTVMMAAMMLPAAAPMILMFATAQARRGPAVAVPTWIFVAGYLLVWAAAGLLVYAVVTVGGALAQGLDATSRAFWAPLALGGTLVAAGLYQLTPLKAVCLRHCRSPFGFVARHWRDGPAGALRMGLLHGAYCLGCCWALFALLVVAGMMSIAWMLLLTLVVAVEKLLPHGRRSALAIGIALLALGLLLAAGVVPTPWQA
jgi:predicted metal-binding membrane protein